MYRNNKNSYFILYIFIFFSFIGLLRMINNPSFDSLYSFICSLWWVLFGVIPFLYSETKIFIEKIISNRAKCIHGIRGGLSRYKCDICKQLEERKAKLLIKISELDSEKVRLIEENRQFKIEAEKKIVDLLKNTIEYYRKMDPFEFENEVAMMFGKMGYTYEVTSKTNDEGKDIILSIDEKITYVECKRFNAKTKVSRPILQKLYGVMVADGVKNGIIVTTSTFTKEAVEFSKKMEGIIELIDCNKLLLINRNLSENKDINITYYQYCNFNLEIKKNNQFSSNIENDYNDYQKPCGDLMKVSFEDEELICKNNHINIPFGKVIREKFINDEQLSSKQYCPKCGSILVKKKQKVSSKKFMGCSNYPNCYFTKNI